MVPSPTIRPYQSSDYPLLCKWWNAHDFAPVPEVMLPRVGAVVGELCAGFLYATDSKICWLEWIVANPEAPKDERSQALDLLLNELCDYAKKVGFGAVFTSSNHNGLMNRLERVGFQKTDTNVTQLIRRL